MRQEPEEPLQTEQYWPPLPPRERRAHRGRGGIGLAIVVGLVAVGVGVAATVSLESGSSPTPSASGTTAGLSANAIASRVANGIVDVVAQDAYSGLVAEGTGLVLSSDGLVLTNNHVIFGSTSVRVTAVVSGHTYTARVLGYDSANDVALLRLASASGLRTVITGNSARIAVGQQVLALGNAQGRSGAPTASSGLITALGQTITPTNTATGMTETLHHVIETSANITDGDSGGALANTSGQVIGVLTASGTGLAGNDVGFAIPVNQALRIARLITAGDQSSTVHIGLPAFLGVSVINSPGSCGEQGGGSAGSVTGAKVCLVYPGTPAERAGLRAGDVITTAGGKSVASANNLTAITGRLQPGTTLAVTYVDTKGQASTVHLTLITGPAQ